MKKAAYISITNKNTLRKFIKESGKFTPFCKKVWLACLEIPAGKTTTYKKIAKKIGKPQAARAVGNALGKNPFAPYVPCHRVLRSDGALGGYSSGLSEKISLLRKEHAKFFNKNF
ncbi:MAG: MGMT family protein [Elusimicrobiota bacterium]